MEIESQKTINWKNLEITLGRENRRIRWEMRNNYIIKQTNIMAGNL